MTLGRPFSDHKTSSDRRDREPVSFNPSLRKPGEPGKRKKHTEDVNKSSKIGPLLFMARPPTSSTSGEAASRAVEDVVNSCSPFRMQSCDLGITRAWKKMAVDRLQAQLMTKSVAETVTKF